MILLQRKTALFKLPMVIIDPSSMITQHLLGTITSSYQKRSKSNDCLSCRNNVNVYLLLREFFRVGQIDLSTVRPKWRLDGPALSWSPKTWLCQLGLHVVVFLMFFNHILAIFIFFIGLKLCLKCHLTL